MSYSRRVGGVALAFAAVAVFAAGCGSSGSNGSAAPKSTATDYFTCLRDNGVNIPQMNRSGRPSGFPSERASRNPSERPSRNPSAGADGGPGGGNGNGFPGGGGFFGSTAPSGVDQQTWDKARQACESLRPTGNPSGAPGRGNNGANAAYRNCLSDHGVTVSGPIEQLDSKDSKVAAALAACAALRPSPRPSN